MRHPYDPTKPDPLEIHLEVEQERLASRFRDRRSRDRIHPIAHDVGCVVDFVIARRRRSAPAVFVAASRVLKHVDTDALRCVVATVLDGGKTDIGVKRRCLRILGYCDTIDAALAVKAEYDRVAAPLLDEIAANKAETARLKKQNDEDALRVMTMTSDTIN